MTHHSIADDILEILKAIIIGIAGIAIIWALIKALF